MWGSLVEMVRKMEPFWSRILEWFDAQARLQCSLHRAANPSKPVRLWSENKSRMMHWYNPTLKRSRGGFVATTRFWWQKNHQQLWATLECVMKFWVLPTPVASQQDLCGSVTTWSLITPDAQVAKLAKGLVSQRWEVLQKKNLLKRTEKPSDAHGKNPKKT